MNDTTTLDPTKSGDPATGTHQNGPTEAERSDAVAIFAFVFAAIGVLTSLFAVGLSVRAVQRADSIENPPAAAAGGGSATEIDLAEFKISPNPVKVSAGATLKIVNKGTTAHDLKVGDIGSETLDAGGSTTLDISELAPGTYDMWCTVAGHKEAGMSGTLEVG